MEVASQNPALSHEIIRLIIEMKEKGVYTEKCQELTRAIQTFLEEDLVSGLDAEQLLPLFEILTELESYQRSAAALEEDDEFLFRCLRDEFKLGALHTRVSNEVLSRMSLALKEKYFRRPFYAKTQIYQQNGLIKVGMSFPMEELTVTEEFDGFQEHFQGFPLQSIRALLGEYEQLENMTAKLTIEDLSSPDILENPEITRRVNFFFRALENPQIKRD